MSATVPLIFFSFAHPPTASAQQSFSLHVGGFVPRGEDARSRDDVLLNNLDFLTFNLDDLHGGTIGAEWLVALGDRAEAGLGLGFYRRTLPSVYTRVVNSNGSEIEQDLRLRIVPFTAVVRLLPFGREAPIQPYIGGGVAALSWRYSETGEFVDQNDRSIFRDRFVGTGSAAGPVILGGMRFGSDAFSMGGEIRYQSAEGKLPADLGFSGDTIDLGGFNYLLTFNVRF
jgi:hypothetical protein